MFPRAQNIFLTYPRFNDHSLNITETPRNSALLEYHQLLIHRWILFLSLKPRFFLIRSRNNSLTK